MKKTFAFVFAALLIGSYAYALPAGNRIPVSGCQSLFLNGANVAWDRYAEDFGPTADTTTYNSWFQPMYQTVRGAGGNSMRLWLHTNGAHTPVYDGNGFAVTIDPAYIQQLHTLLDLAQNAGVMLVFSLWSFDMQQNQSGVNLEYNRRILQVSANTQAYINNVLTPLVNGLKGHPALLAWEIFNEPEGMSNEFGWSTQKVAMSDIQRVCNQFAGAIHRADPNALVTNGSWSFKSNCDNSGYGFMNYYTDSRLVAAGGDSLGTLDFYEVHYYSNWGSQAQDLTHSPFHHPISFWGLDKPLVIGEFYAQDTYGVLAADLENNLYQNGYAGGWGWTYANNWSQIQPGVQKVGNLYPADTLWTPGCNYTRTPTPTNTPVVPDTARYPFEDGSTQGWSIETPSSVGLSLANSTAIAHAGTHSLALSVTVPGGSYQAANIYVSGQYPSGTASAWVYLPSGGPSGLDARFYIQDKNWTWFESPTVSLVPGTWTQVTWNLGSAAFASPVQRVGLRLGGSVPYNGILYIDSVNFTDATPPTPTITPTPTATAFVADTARFPFEDGTNQGWAIEMPSSIGLSLVNTNALSHAGYRSLALSVTYTGGTYGAANVFVANQPVSGTATGWVYLPSGAPGGMDVKFYLQDANWTWAEGPTTILVPGTWNQISWNLNAAAFVNPVQRIGLRIGSSLAYQGTLYIDSIDFALAPLPTPTVTATPSLTLVVPSGTATPSATRSPSFSATTSPTPISTVTATPPVATKSPTPSLSLTVSFSAIATPSLTLAAPWGTATPTVSPSASFSASPSRSTTVLFTVTPTWTLSFNPSRTPSRTPTSTPIFISSATPTPSLTLVAPAGTATALNAPDSGACGISRLVPVPNPNPSGLRFYADCQAGGVVLGVYSSSFRRVKSLQAAGPFPVGWNWLVFPNGFLDDLPAGVYYISLRSDGEGRGWPKAIAKVVLTK